MKPEGDRPERSDSTAQGETGSHPVSVSLWEQFVSRENLGEALRRVERNAGAPGIDGMGTTELRPWLKVHWPQIRAQLDTGTYRPAPARRVMIPKPSGGQRRLGVPTALDRLLQQALAQVLTPIFDPTFPTTLSAFVRGAQPTKPWRGHARPSAMAGRGPSIWTWTRFSTGSNMTR